MPTPPSKAARACVPICCAVPPADFDTSVVNIGYPLARLIQHAGRSIDLCHFTAKRRDLLS